MSDNFLIQQYLDESALRSPENIAVVDGKSSLCYRELLRLSNALGYGLKALGVARQDRVVVCLPRSVGCLPAILGVLKADAIYVPLDHKAPLERCSHIIEDATPRVIICDSSTLHVAREAVNKYGSGIAVMRVDHSGRPLLDDQLPAAIDNDNAGHPTYSNTQEDLAYILYTSGSTGRPKGVMITHANVRAYIDWASTYLNISENDSLLGTAPFHFDMSTFDIYCALKCGAKLCVASDLQTMFPEKLVNYIEQQRVTLWKGVASLLMYMSRTGVLRPGAMPTLKQVLFAGETLPTRYLIDWMTVFPEKVFYNAYGPTETTGACTCYRVDSIPEGPHVRIPIGAPRIGTRILLLNESLEEPPAGESGELCVAGDGLARGYLNDPEKTARAFVLDPLSRSGEMIYRTGDLARQLPDGNFEYLGRKDRQLKFMGYRIEAGEIEQALLSIPRIKDTVVDLMASKLGEGAQELAAFWESDEEIDATVIATELRMRLPSYMIPRRYIRVEKMPRCERGKIKLDTLKNQYQSF